MPACVLALARSPRRALSIMYMHTYTHTPRLRVRLGARSRSRSLIARSHDGNDARESGHLSHVPTIREIIERATAQRHTAQATAAPSLPSERARMRVHASYAIFLRSRFCAPRLSRKQTRACACVHSLRTACVRQLLDHRAITPDVTS